MADRTEDIEIRLLLEALFQKYHYDFRGYAMASLKRRLKQAREHLGFATISAMQDRLLHDATMLPKLLGYLTVQVSEMFRDPAYFRAIREKVVPHLRTYPSLKVWVAGCSAGEELYSFVILFREEGLEDRTLFYATDINQDALSESRDRRLRSRSHQAVYRKPSPVGRKVVAVGLLHRGLRPRFLQQEPSPAGGVFRS